MNIFVCLYQNYPYLCNGSSTKSFHKPSKIMNLSFPKPAQLTNREYRQATIHIQKSTGKTFVSHHNFDPIQVETNIDRLVEVIECKELHKIHEHIDILELGEWKTINAVSFLVLDLVAYKVYELHQFLGVD